MYDKNYIEVSNVLEEDDNQSERAGSDKFEPEDMKFDNPNQSQ